jgi:hypothetical protein
LPNVEHPGFDNSRTPQSHAASTTSALHRTTTALQDTAMGGMRVRARGLMWEVARGGRAIPSQHACRDAGQRLWSDNAFARLFKDSSYEVW